MSCLGQHPNMTCFIKMSYAGQVESMQLSMIIKRVKGSCCVKIDEFDLFN